MAARLVPTRRRVFLALAVMLLLAAVGITILLGTERGRQRLLDTVCAFATSPAFRLEMHGLTLGEDWTLSSLTVSDAAGPWLAVTGIRLRPVLPELLAGRISLDRLSIREVDLDRLPVADGSQAGAAWPRLRVRAVDAGRVRLGGEVAGTEALLTVHGGLSLDSRTVQGSLEVARLDRENDRLSLEGHADLAGRMLTLDLDLHEAPGGVLHSLLHAKGTQGISVRAAGQGTLREFPLSLKADVADAGSLTGNATLNFESAPNATLTALLAPGPSWTTLTGLPPQNTEVSVRGDWAEPDLNVSLLELRAPLAAMTGNATWNMESGAFESRFQAEGRDLQPVLPSAATAGKTSARGIFKADATGIHARVQASADDWTVAGHALSRAEADLAMDLPASSQRWQVATQANATLPDLPEGLRAWTATASLDGDSAGADIDGLSLSSDRLGLQLNGHVGKDLSLTGRIALRDILLPPGHSVSASLDAALRGQYAAASRILDAEMDLNATSLEGLPQKLATLLGQNPAAQARFTVSADRVEISRAQLKARTALELHGDYSLEEGRFQADFSAMLPEFRQGSLLLAPGLGVRGRATGTPAAFTLDLEAADGRLQCAGLDLRDMRAKAALRGLPQRPALTAQARMQASDQPASLSLDAVFGGKALRITKCQFELPANVFNATGTLDPSSLLFSGTAEFRSRDLSVPGRILQTDLGGELSMRAELAAAKNSQSAVLDAQGKDLKISGLSLARASLAGSSGWPESAAGTDLRLELESAAFGPLRADRIKGHMKSAPQGLSFDLNAAHSATDTAISADGTFTPASRRLLIGNVQGRLLRENLRLASPVTAIWSSDGMQWDESSLAFGRAGLTTRGSIAPDRVDVTATLRDLDPAQLRPLFANLPAARINANLEVRGTPDIPDARLAMRAEDIRVRTPGIDNLPGLGVTAEAVLRQGRLDATVALASENAVALRAALSCPVHSALPAVEIASDAPLTGSIEGYAELGILPNLLRLEDQTVEGRCDLNLGLGGTRGNPELTGRAKVRNGRYENFRSGTAVESSDVDLTARGSILELNATASDGSAGRALGRGTVDLAALTYVFDVNFSAFRLIRLDLAQGTAAGPFRFGGDLNGSELTGNLILDPSSVDLPRSTAAEAPVIDITEINAQTATGRNAKPSQPYLIALNLDVGIPARLTVRGRGLDSEWAGRLHLGGNHVRPSISGEMNLLRGRYEFLDRNFDLTKGSLLLGGDTPPNPFLDMVGVTQVLDTQVQVHLNGPMRNFRLSLTSVPALPQDELLAMILFGRSMHEISPLQAVVLAQTAAEMTGVGPNLDILGTIKSRLGLQEVDVSKDEHDNTAVGIGGYVGGKYYIRTQRSVSGQDKTRVEVQLTPKISVETEVGGDSRQGGGVNWKHDY